MDRLSRIYVAGHSGLLGSAVLRLLESSGYVNIITASRGDVDLTVGTQVEKFFMRYKPEYVILAAGKVGGIVDNQSFPADFMNMNLKIQMNVFQAAHSISVEKLVFFASSCMYPRTCSQPMAESDLFSGQPEGTSLAYAVSKLAGLQMCLAYNQQFNNNRFIPVIPNSTYGPNDNFDPRSGHVLAALLKRFHDAKANGSPSLRLWGSGDPCREFIHADDVAGACLMILERDTSQLQLPLNLGTGEEISIKALANEISSVVGYTGVLEWDLSKPDGAPRKLLDSSRARHFGWAPRIDLRSGLRSTYSWYQSNILGLGRLEVQGE